MKLPNAAQQNKKGRFADGSSGFMKNFSGAALPAPAVGQIWRELTAPGVHPCFVRVDQALWN